MAGNQVPFDQLKVPANKYGTDGSSLPDYQRAFIERFAPYAMLAASQTGLPARFLLAEASIETDWGRSGSATRGNNMFGIKASKGQIAAGVPVEYLPTTEYINGVKTTEVSPFIKYKTAEDGFNGFVEKLQRTKYPDQKALLNHRSDTPLAQDDATEKALSDAFGRTSYLTMPGINQTMLDRLARFPADLQRSGFKTAVDFSKASNDLAGLVGYDGGQGYPDASNGLDNDGLGSFGINGITFNRTPSSEGTLDYLSNQLTGGLRDVGSTIADAYANVTGRLPSVGELKSRVDDVASGARSLFDQLGDIAGSAEAKTFSQATGIDPSQYVVNDIYRLGLDRNVDAGSAASQMEVLRNQGGQSLYDQLTNSQEGRTLALNDFYGNAFDRPADSGGLQYALDQMAQGRSLQSVETQLLQSPEAQALGIMPSQYASLLTPDLYKALANTDPTTGTINTGTQVGTQGPDTTVSTIGAPGISPIINDLYQGILQRAPDAQGAQGFEGLLAAGVPADLIQAQILNSAEAAQTLGPDRLASMLNDYQTAHGRSADTAATLAPLASEFSQTLNRGIDAPTLQAWGQQIQSGTPSSIMEAQLLAAPEVQQARTGSLDSLTSQYQAKYGLLPTEVNTLSPLASQFQQALQRGVDTPTLQAWDAQLDAGTPLSILQAQLFGAPEVQARGSDALAPLINNYQTQYGMAPQEVAALAPLASQFSQLLGRPADTPTLQAWDAQIDAGTSMPTLQAQLLQAPEVTARTGGAGDLYNAFQGQYGRSASDYLAGLSNPNGFTGVNTSGSVGNGTFSGTFDPTQYLAANRDVQAAGMDPLTHYLTYGYNEGRALDTAGDRINKGFDASAYLNANPDVKAAGLDPLYQYITSGASEGRAMPTGSNPYSFSGINVGQGVGAGTFSGTFDPSQYLAANRDVAASGMDPLTHYLTYGFNEGRSLDTAGDKINQGFDPKAYLAQNPDVAAAHMDPLYHYLTSGASQGRAVPTGTNPYSFSNFNVGGYQIPNGSGSGAVGSLSVNNASGAANGLGGSGGAGGSAFGYSDSSGNPQVATFNPQQAEMNYLQGQVNQTNQMIAAGQQETANNPNAANGALANIGFGIQTAINPTAGLGAGIQNFGSNAAIGTYGLPAVTPLSVIPVLPGGLRGTAAIGGYLGGNGFGGAGGFF